MRIKKYAAAFLAATTVLGSMAACGEKTDGPAATPTPSTTDDTEQPDAEQARNLGGMEIIIGDHWSPEEPEPPKSTQEEATLAYRNEFMAKHNFTIKQVAVADWEGMTDECTNGILAGDPKAEVFVLDSSFVSKPMSNGLFYDLATLEEFDFTEEKWNKAAIELMTKDGSIYGMASGRSEARLGLFWNKRLFEEAGIDPELPYNLQASGEWTWTAFKDLCEKLTKDTNSDGVMDTYAMGNFGPDICKALINSTGTELVTMDENDNFVNNSGDQRVLDALNFAKELGDAGYEMPQPADTQWDWFKQAFADGWFAMQFNETYMATQTWADMEDDFGFVCAPKPDGADGYHTIFNENIVIIPSCFDAAKASDIAFAYNLWTNPTPGYEEEGDWKDTYYTRFRDERAVDETLEIFYTEGVANFEHLVLVYGLSYGDICYSYPFGTQTPAEKIEEIKNTWDSAIAEANK